MMNTAEHQTKNHHQWKFEFNRTSVQAISMMLITVTSLKRARSKIIKYCNNKDQGTRFLYPSQSLESKRAALCYEMGIKEPQCFCALKIQNFHSIHVFGQETIRFYFSSDYQTKKLRDIQSQHANSHPVQLETTQVLPILF